LLAGASAAIFDKPKDKNADESFQEGYTPKNMSGVLHNHDQVKGLKFPKMGGINFQHVAEVQM
jgi:hypothetical protein